MSSKSSDNSCDIRSGNVNKRLFHESGLGTDLCVCVCRVDPSCVRPQPLGGTRRTMVEEDLAVSLPHLRDQRQQVFRHSLGGSEPMLFGLRVECSMPCTTNQPPRPYCSLFTVFNTRLLAGVVLLPVAHGACGRQTGRRGGGTGGRKRRGKWDGEWAVGRGVREEDEK